MTRTKTAARRGLGPIKDRYRGDRIVFHRGHMEKLKIKKSSRPILYADLVKWCRNDCPEKFAGHVGGEITLEEAKNLAQRIGKKFWGEQSQHVVEKDGERELRWPVDEDAYADASKIKHLQVPPSTKAHRIYAGLHVLLTKMTARHDVKPKTKELHNDAHHRDAETEEAAT